MSKKFSKSRWLKTATEQKEQGILTQAEIDDALEIWVNDLDGKTVDEISADGDNNIVDRKEWFV